MKDSVIESAKNRKAVPATVISNPNREYLGGFRLLFISNGERVIAQSGWRTNRFDFFALDFADFAHPLRIGDGSEFIRKSKTVKLQAPQITYSEFFKGPSKFGHCWILFRAKSTNTPIHKLISSSGYCLFDDPNGLIPSAIQETKHIAASDPGLQWIGQAAFLRILALLHQSTGTSIPDLRTIRPIVNKKFNSNQFGEQIARFVNENFFKDISIDALAKHLGISRSSLTHRFSTEMGETLTELKNRLRIERAQQLIATTNKQFKEIAFELGFEDSSYFTYLFRKISGVSPKSYKALLTRNQ